MISAPRGSQSQETASSWGFRGCGTVRHRYLRRFPFRDAAGAGHPIPRWYSSGPGSFPGSHAHGGAL